MFSQLLTADDSDAPSTRPTLGLIYCGGTHDAADRLRSVNGLAVINALAAKATEAAAQYRENEFVP